MYRQLFKFPTNINTFNKVQSKVFDAVSDPDNACRALTESGIWVG
jgi:hypothetical protein